MLEVSPHPALYPLFPIPDRDLLELIEHHYRGFPLLAGEGSHRLEQLIEERLPLPAQVELELDLRLDALPFDGHLGDQPGKQPPDPSQRRSDPLAAELGDLPGVGGDEILLGHHLEQVQVQGEDAFLPHPVEHLHDQGGLPVASGGEEDYVLPGEDIRGELGDLPRAVGEALAADDLSVHEGVLHPRSFTQPALRSLRNKSIAALFFLAKER